MRIFFLNPSWGKDWCRSARWAAKSRGRVQRHPDWVLIAVAYLEKNGHQCKFLDAAALNIDKQESIENILQYNPEMVVIHTTTPSIYNDISYAREIKNFKAIKTVLIGSHVSAEPDNTFSIAEDCVDFIVRGEYELPLLGLANKDKIEKIPGISYKVDNQVIHNPLPERQIDVNTLPFPAWHHIKPEWYHDAGKLYPFLTLISARGCVGRCTFCRDPQTFYKRRLRLRDPKLVVDEMEYDLKMFPQIREIMFETDTFASSPKHAREICEEIISRGIKIPWSCNVRVDIDLDLLPIMKKAGCRMLMTGFEFGYQEGLDVVKKDTTIEQSKRFAEVASKLGLIIHGCFMIGAPNETREQAEETIKFAKSLPLDTIQISGICVYPGTQLYEWAKENNYIVPDDWEGWVNEEHEQITMLNYPQLSTDEMNELIDKGLKSFYLRPKQLFRMLKTIRSVGDIRRKLFGFKSFLNYFGHKKRTDVKNNQDG